MQQSEGIAWGLDGGIGRITLKRPERANAIGRTSAGVLVRAIDEVIGAKPRAILLAGEGRVFCAGGDIEEFVAAGEALPELVRRFPALRLAGAVLVEAHDEWQVSDRRYLSEGSMALLTETTREVAPAQLMPA